MRNALDLNTVSTLSTILLTNLDEGLFFAKLSEATQMIFNEYKIQVYEVYSDGATKLRSENGKIVEAATEFAKGQGVSGYVARTKRAYYSNTVKRDPLMTSTQKDTNVECELIVPVMSGSQVIATLHVQSSDMNRNFNQDDINSLMELIGQLERPISNMGMFLSAKNLNRELMQKIELKEKELEVKGNGVGTSSRIKERVELIGHSSAFMNIVNSAKKIATEDFPVIITGANGVGKKQIAKKIHELSNRRDNGVQVVHCSTMDANQSEIELFGFADRAGVIERVNGGTLILDSIDELPMSTQAKLLRVIVSGELYRVDGQNPISVNVRIIATAKDSLDKAVEDARFREDLNYRLSTIKLEIPSLIERQDDLKLLAEYFLNEGKKREDAKTLTSSAIEKLSQYNWPGNLRELRNLMERTFILSDEKYIEAKDLPELAIEVAVTPVISDEFEEVTLHELEKKHIIRTLSYVEGNKTKAAKSLGITVKTLYNKLHSYGLVHSKVD
jgi:Nif-specific regulatory protein